MHDASECIISYIIRSIRRNKRYRTMDLVKDIKKMFYVCFRDKLAPVKLNRYKDDLLFYMFYTNVGDVLQLAAAAEL